MNLDDDELITTRIMNGSMSRKDIVNYVNLLNKEIRKLREEINKYRERTED